MESDDLWVIAWIVVGLLVFIGLAVVSIQAVSLWVNRVPVIVLVDGRDVYHGIRGCVDVSSGGTTTQVEVKGGFLCFMPRATYVSNDVRIEGDIRSAK